MQTNGNMHSLFLTELDPAHSCACVHTHAHVCPHTQVIKLSAHSHGTYARPLHVTNTYARPILVAWLTSYIVCTIRCSFFSSCGYFGVE